MKNYCEDKFSCRRELQLHYLGEKFDPDDCHKQCDNCINRDKPFLTKDYTEEGKLIVQSLLNVEITEKQLVSLLKGQTIAAAKTK